MNTTAQTVLAGVVLVGLPWAGLIYGMIRAGLKKPACRQTGPWADLGWANSWRETPRMVRRCRRRGHHPSDRDLSQWGTGSRHVVRCDQCRYEYREDSSG